jgi:integrase
VTTTKTRKTRKVPLVRELAEALVEHRGRLLAEQHPGLVAGWVFSTRHGELFAGSVLLDVVRRSLARAKIAKRLTVHGLRRTFNNLARQVTTGGVVRSIVGHSTAAMTEHYSHIGAAEKLAVGAEIVRLVKNGGSSGGSKSGEDGDGADP